MTVDLTITLGNIIEIGSIICGGLMVLAALKSDVRLLKNGASGLKRDVDGIQAELKKLGEIVVDLANIRGDLRGMNIRITAAEQDIRELRHGDGFVQGPRGIDREFGR